MQHSSINLPVFGLTLAALALFGVVFALAVRKISENNVHGQTAYLVVLGTAVTLAGAAFVIGIQNALLAAACFGASGLPMVIEYASRTHAAQAKDRNEAKDVARELLQ